MDEFIKLLDKNLAYVDHNAVGDTIFINVISTCEYVICPYCQTRSDRVHSYYKRSFQDLPMQGKKVMIILNNRKMLCSNPDCDHKTFAESFDFLPYKAKKTSRLEKEIINISQNVSSLAATQILNIRVAKVGKSTICNLLKKRTTND